MRAISERRWNCCALSIAAAARPGELLQHGELLRAQDAPGRARDQRHDAERAAADGERDAGRAADAQPQRELVVARVDGGVAQVRGVDVGVQFAAAAACGGGRARGARRIDDQAAHVRRERGVGGIGVRHRHPLEAAIGEHVDHAPVGQGRHRELRRAPERLLEVERLAKDAAGLREEAQRRLDLLELGDVLDDVDRPRHGAAGVAHGLGLDAHPAHRPGRADPVAQHQRLGHLARERTPAGQARGVDGPPVLVPSTASRAARSRGGAASSAARSGYPAGTPSSRTAASLTYTSDPSGSCASTASATPARIASSSTPPAARGRRATEPALGTFSFES